jgi:hypothetical protein
MEREVSEEAGAYYVEVQRFRQPWLWGLLLVTCLPVAVVMLYGLWVQLVRGEPWGNQPLSDTGLVIVVGLTLLVLIGVIALLIGLTLVVRVERGHLRVRFRPFARRDIPFGEIERWEVRNYRPLAEYGGWGLRWGGRERGWAYTVSGNRGVRLELAGGKALLLGSQRPEELAAALAQATGRG